MDALDAREATAHLIDAAGEIVSVDGRGIRVFVDEEQTATTYADTGAREDESELLVIGFEVDLAGVDIGALVIRRDRSYRVVRVLTTPGSTQLECTDASGA